MKHSRRKPSKSELTQREIELNLRQQGDEERRLNKLKYGNEAGIVPDKTPFYR